MNYTRKMISALILIPVLFLLANWMLLLEYHLMRVVFLLGMICVVGELLRIILTLSRHKPKSLISDVFWVSLVISIYLSFFIKPAESLKDFVTFSGGMVVLIIAFVKAGTKHSAVR